MKGPLLKRYERGVWFTYHMDSPGHDTYNSWTLRHSIQDLTEKEPSQSSLQLLNILEPILYLSTRLGPLIRQII